MRWENPAPKRMYWRPDKMIVEYEANSGDDNPFVQVAGSSPTNLLNLRSLLPGGESDMHQLDPVLNRWEIILQRLTRAGVLGYV